MLLLIVLMLLLLQQPPPLLHLLHLLLLLHLHLLLLDVLLMLDVLVLDTQELLLLLLMMMMMMLELLLALTRLVIPLCESVNQSLEHVAHLGLFVEGAPALCFELEPMLEHLGNHLDRRLGVERAPRDRAWPQRTWH
jgi:hypothetical protein